MTTNNENPANGQDGGQANLEAKVATNDGNALVQADNPVVTNESGAIEGILTEKSKKPLVFVVTPISEFVAIITACLKQPE